MKRNPYAPPSATVADPEARETPEIPDAVRRAAILMALSVLLNLVILGLDWRYCISQSKPIVLVVSEAIAVAIVGLLIWKITAGRNWARIVLLVLTALALPGMFVDVLASASRIAHIAGLKLVEMGLDVGVIYLLFFPGRAFFRRQT